jgi:hypothetical protein
MSSRSLSSPKLSDFTAVEHPLSFLSRRIGANFTRHSPLCKGKQGRFGGVLSKIPLNPPLPKGDFKNRELCEFSQSREENLKLTPMRAGGNPERSGHPLMRPHLLLPVTIYNGIACDAPKICTHDLKMVSIRKPLYFRWSCRGEVYPLPEYFGIIANLGRA